MKVTRLNSGNLLFTDKYGETKIIRPMGCDLEGNKLRLSFHRSLEIFNKSTMDFFIWLMDERIQIQFKEELSIDLELEGYVQEVTANIFCIYVEVY